MKLRRVLRIGAVFALGLQLGCGSDDVELGDTGVDAQAIADASGADGSIRDAQPTTDTAVELDSQLFDASAVQCTPTRSEVGVVSSFFVPMQIQVTRDAKVHAVYAGVNIGGAVPYYTNATGSWTEELVKDDSFFHVGTRVSVVPVYQSEHAYLFAAGSWVTNRSGSWEATDAPFGLGAGPGRKGALYGPSTAGLQSNRDGTWEELIALEEQHGCQAFALGVNQLVTAACLRRDIETGLHELHYVQENAAGTFSKNETGLAFEKPNELLVAAGNGRPQFTILVGGNRNLVRWNGSMWTATTIGGDFRRFLGLAVSGQDDSAHILDGYFTTGLRYITNASGEWVTAEVNPSFLEGMAAITIDADDRLHLAYAGQYDGAKRVKYERICL